MAVVDNNPIEPKHFDFENELILGPVYKRVLFSHLCTLPAVTKSPASDPSEALQTVSSSIVTSSNQGSSVPQVAGSSTTEATSSDDVDWSPENIVRILRESGGFSVSVLVDLTELKLAEDPSRLPKRSLPLGSILKQHQMVSEAQKFMNTKLIFGAVTDDVDVVAQALEEGAEINTTSDSGLTALQISLGESPSSEVAGLLLLYKETKTHLRNDNGETLLHQAVRAGNLPLVRRLIKSVDDLRVVDGSGATPLHVAARGGHHRLAVLQELNSIFSGLDICADKCLDRMGRTPLHEAAQGGHVQHTAQLLRLGCDPTFLPKPTRRATATQVLGSPLWLAVEAGHANVVRKIFYESSLCADRTGLVDLANWKHHPQRSLLDCVVSSLHSQRQEIAEVLISHGLDWKSTARYGDKLLEFANTGTAPLLLLRLISGGCMPMLRPLDITKSMPSLMAVNYPELVAMALFSLSSINAAHVSDLSRPQIYARMGSGEASSLLTETLTLSDILTQILSGKTSKPAKEHAALTHTEAAKDPLVPASIALHTNITMLGRLYYEIDKCLVDPAASNEAGMRYLKNFVRQNIITGS
jgi:ankyrin repeat protein